MSKQVKRLVNTSFWEDEKVVNMFSPEDKYFMLYLLTNPHTTQLGIYKLVPKVAAFELGYSVEAVMVLLDRFEKKYDILKYSPKTSEVAIKNFLRHSVVKGGKPVMDLLVKEESEVKDKSLLLYIYNSINNINNLNITVREYINHLENLNDNDNDNERIVACDFLRLREEVIKQSERLPDEGMLTCEWCGNKVASLDNHHFPMPKGLGGKETVRICKKCHNTFHTLEYQNRLGRYSQCQDVTQTQKADDDEIEAVFEALWKMYPRKLGKGSIKTATKKRIYTIGFDVMKKCIERYKKAIIGKDEQYVMYGSTFFNSGYVDYLDENYCNNQDADIVEEEHNAGWQ